MATFKDIFRDTLSARLLSIVPLFLLCVLLVSGCSQPIKIAYKSSKPLAPHLSGEKAKTKSPVAFFVEPFSDERGEPGRASKINPRVIGTITAVVSDYIGSELEISDPPEDVVTQAFSGELKNSGYRVLTAGEKSGADFVVKGALKAFRLDIGSRDEIDVRVYLKITETETGRVIWEGMAAEKNSRFAGVMGNNKDDISAYAAQSIRKAIKGAIEEASALIENTRAAYAGTKEKKNEPANPRQGTGRLVVAAQPNAKVYVNGVYFGITPFKTDMEPGVYELSVKQRGFKEAKERVSVRLGELTEIIVTLDKE